MKKYRVLKEFVHTTTRKRYFPGDLYAAEKASDKMLSDGMLVEVTAADTILQPDQVEKKDVAGNPGGIDFGKEESEEQAEEEQEESDTESEESGQETQQAPSPQKARKRKGR